MNKNNVQRQNMMQAMMGRTAEAAQPQTQDSFSRLNAAELHCPKCRTAQPVREKPLLYLADGQLFDYLCVQCGTSLGTRKE